VTYGDFDEVVESEDTPILLITPGSAATLLREDRDWSSSERFVSFYIDAPDEELSRRLSERDNEQVDEEQVKRRKRDRTFKKEFIYQLQNYHTSITARTIHELWIHRDKSGILPKSLIENMTKCGMLIENADTNSISHASYDLRLGIEHYQRGEIRELSESDPFIQIEPYDYAVVMTEEVVHFPRNIAGRFDLQVGLFFQGVILSNGPQVDPGFNGKLFCLLFNTSDSIVSIKRGESFATLEFHKTLASTEPYDGPYQGEEKIAGYLPNDIMRGGIYELKQEIDKMEAERERLQSVVFTRNLTVALGIISLVLAIVALIVSILIAILNGFDASSVDLTNVFNTIWAPLPV
jgi:deoxycytidine triphosphate deaminase